MTSRCISKALVIPVPLHVEPRAALLHWTRQPEQAFPPELLNLN